MAYRIGRYSFVRVVQRSPSSPSGLDTQVDTCPQFLL
jgi:hypothetical protein